MRIKTILLVLVAVAAALPVQQARSQMIGESLISWFTGDPNVGNGPTVEEGPKLYAEDTCCADGCCSQCSHCMDTFGSVEFLMWWAKGTPLPPLVTTSDQTPLTPQTNAGVLGFNTTSVLFGNQMAGNKLQAGGRITAGLWLDPDHNIAVGGRFFGTGGDVSRYNQRSSGNPILAMPFFNAQLNQEDSLIIAYPGFNRGSIDAHLTTNNIIGAEAFGEIMMSRDCRRRIDLVGGYQFFRMDDWLQIDSTSTLNQAGNPLNGLRIDVTDRFSTRNQFHGGEFGLRARMARGQWSLNVLSLIGLGNMNQQVTINGSTTVTSPGGAPNTSAGGLFTQPSNISQPTYERNQFCWIPQLTGNLNYHINPNISFHIGYNIMWISNVALSGDQIDTTINLGQPNGPARPAFAFNDREYWLQGINWGMNWDF